MNNLTSSTSTLAPWAKTPDALPALPVQVVHRIFGRLAATYGAAAVTADDPQLKLVAWSQGLAGFSVEELTRGVFAMASRFCPELSEFRLLCRPALDAETAWSEALAGINTFRTFGWSHRCVRDAAQAFAFELYAGQPFAQVRKRWEFEMRRQWDLDRARAAASHRAIVSEGTLLP